MSALYLLAGACGLGVMACLGAMYLILRSVPVRRVDEA